MSTGLQQTEGMPTWKTESPDGTESHQNSAVSKSNSGLNGKQSVSN